MFMSSGCQSKKNMDHFIEEKLFMFCFFVPLGKLSYLAVKFYNQVWNCINIRARELLKSQVLI
jgi:hypothetical protein